MRCFVGSRDAADLTDYAYYMTDVLAGCGAAAGCARKGDRRRVTNALGHVTEVLAYDRAGRPVRVRDPNDTRID